MPVVLISLFVACGGGDSKQADKRKKLEELKSQVSKMQTEIAKLEEELLAGGDSVPAGKTAKVILTRMAPTSFNHYVEVQGKVESEQNVMVSPRMGGTITEIFVHKGDFVNKGQLLVQIDDELIRRGIDEVRTQLELSTTIFNKQKSLWDQKIGTEVQFITAKANKESLERRLASLEDQKDMCKVKSPISGSIDEVIPKTGEAAIPGFGMIRVVNLSNAKILAEISESYYTKIKTGDEVELYFPDQQKSASTTVRVKSQTINMVNRTFNIETKAPGTDVVVRPNMVVEVRVKDYENKVAMVIPVNMVQHDDKNNEFVYLAMKEGSKLVARRHMVKSGVSYKGNVEVLEGLSEGDELVTIGYQNLVEGQIMEVTH